MDVTRMDKAVDKIVGSVESVGTVAATDAADTLELEHGIPVVHVAEESLTAGDRSLSEVAEIMAARKGPLKLRVTIQLWDGEQYRSWKGQIWKVDTRGAEEAKEVQTGLELFFECVAKLGADATVSALAKIKNQK